MNKINVPEEKILCSKKGLICLKVSNTTIIFLFILSNFLDIDECTDGGHDCHTDANCANSPGTFSCTCKPGYTGNGTSCTGKLIEIICRS